MFLIASIVLAAAAGYAYIGLRIGVLEEYPLLIIALLLVSVVLAFVHFGRAKRWYSKVAAGLPLIFCGLFLYGLLFMTTVGDRPAGPLVGEKFPELVLTRAVDSAEIPVGRAAAAGQLQLVVLFRGFW